MSNKQLNEFSLLWLTPSDPSFDLEEKAIEDMNLTQVIEMFLKSNVKEVLTFIKKVPSSVRTIKYRQDILSDFVHNEGLFEAFKDTLEKCSEIKNLIKFAFEREATLYNLLLRIDEVGKVMLLTEKIAVLLKESNLKSEGLIGLREFLRDTVDTDIYVNFKDDLQSIKKMDESVRSIKVGMNLDENLKPYEAIVLTLEEQHFKYSRNLKKAKKIINYGLNELKSIPRKIFAPESLALPEALNDLEKIIAPAMKQLIAFCDQFNGSLLSIYEPIKQELLFFEMGLKIHQTLSEAGFSLCQPEILKEGMTEIEGLYNISLANEMIKSQTMNQMVYNDLTIESNGNIFILTGANRGGKTTYTQGIGQIYWFAHLGLYIAARKARIRIIDGLYLHFPNDEQKTVNYGRLGEECQRFSIIFTKLSPQSLLLMNESFAGTSHLESLTIATEVIKAIQLLGASLIFNTHLHELGEKIDVINSNKERSPKLISLVSGTVEHLQSFKVHQGVPLGQSYAKEIAIKYGVSYEQLVQN